MAVAGEHDAGVVADRDGEHVLGRRQRGDDGHREHVGRCQPDGEARDHEGHQRLHDDLESHHRRDRQALSTPATDRGPSRSDTPYASSILGTAMFATS